MSNRVRRRKLLLGAHVSIAGGLHNAPHNGLEATCEVVQIFTKTSNQWRERTVTRAEVKRFVEAQEATGVRVVAAHDSYLINLASPDGALFKRSCTAFAAEVRRCNRLGIPNLVMHPGAHVGSGVDRGLQRVAEALNRVLDRDPRGGVAICLETTAGQGTGLGSRFEELAEILDRLERPDRAGICLDTCHLFAAGYPLRTLEGYRNTLRAFHRTIGLDRLRVIHMNDSRKPRGSRVDRHARIGEGRIGKRPFGHFLNDRRLARVPKILETPKETAQEDRESLDLLRSLVRRRR